MTRSRHCECVFFMLFFTCKGVENMENIADYIRQNKKLKNLDFLTCYLTITELIKDGKIELKNNV